MVLRRGRRDTWVVETAQLRASLPAAGLVPVAGPPTAASRPTFTFDLDADRHRAALDLNVRGQRLAEALQNVEQQLDAAVLRGVSEFTILHGKGEGVLRTGIHEYLSRAAAVADFHSAPADQGGDGKTVVRLGDG